MIRLVQLLRGAARDREKGLQVVRELDQAVLDTASRDRDALLLHASRARPPFLGLGTGTTLTGRRLPFRLGLKDQFAHHLIQGATGSGKTRFAASLMTQNLSQRAACGLVDLKGDLFYLLLHWVGGMCYRLPAREREDLKRRLVVLQPTGSSLVPLNFCRPTQLRQAEAQAAELTSALARLYEGDLGARMRRILHHVIVLLVDAELTLLEARDVLQDELVRLTLAHRCRHPETRRFFEDDFDAEPQISKVALLARLDGLFASEAFRLMVGADDMLDLREVFEHGKILLVFLGRGGDATEEHVRTLGHLLFQELVRATFSRRSGRATPYQLFIDEFHYLVGDVPALARQMETFLASSRSFGTTATLIHHGFMQVPPSLRDMLLVNCDLLSLFRMGNQQLRHFADVLPSADSLRAFGPKEPSQLPNRMFWAHDRRHPWPAVQVHATDMPSPASTVGLTERQLDRYIDAQSIALCGGRSRDELQRQIARRRERLTELVSVSRRTPERRGSKGPQRPRRDSWGPKLG